MAVGGSLDALTAACSSRADLRDFGGRGWEDERFWFCCFKILFWADLERLAQASENSTSLSSSVGGSTCIFSDMLS